MDKPHVPLDCAPDVHNALQAVTDPCLAASGHPFSIVDLGLIHSVIETDDSIEVRITFTEVGCQFTHRVIGSIEEQVLSLGRFKHVRVIPEWRPGWTEDRMTDSARAALSRGRVHALKNMIRTRPTVLQRP